jgi:NADH-quinone oxidoreductase subunit C/D
VAEPLGVPGDIHHRFVARLHEIIQSAKLLQELTHRLPTGGYRLRSVNEDLVAAGTALATVEAPRGRLGLSLSSDGKRQGPAEIGFLTPSATLIEILPRYLEGAPVQDLSLFLHALDFKVTEVDR